jgi:hypothetical protein
MCCRNSLWGNLKNSADFAFSAFKTIFGTQAWIRSAATGVTASAGIIMLAALPVILGSNSYRRLSHWILPPSRGGRSALFYPHLTADGVPDFDSGGQVVRLSSEFL